MPKLRNGSKGGFEPGFSRLRVRHSTTELPRSTRFEKWYHFAFIYWAAQYETDDHNTPQLTCSSEIFAPTIMCKTDRSSSLEIMLSPSRSYMLKATIKQHKNTAQFCKHDYVLPDPKTYITQNQLKSKSYYSKQALSFHINNKSD